ncbi:MAG: lysophospholipid acyltransferase family protein, partial [Verrucomicrobiae bacterium]|nr:lysophospholipid acyltransferase family protein [Verrucomicrobiae bacterium]
PNSNRVPDRPTSPRNVVPQQTTFLGGVGAGLVYAAVTIIDVTLRYSWTVHPTAADALMAGPVIFAIWHNRLALSLVLYRRACRMYRTSGHWVTAPPRMAAMVSASRDGGFLARVLELFGVQPVRGSTSRRGPQAMLELTTWAEHGYDLAVTPDGPRGPREIVQDGILALAQVTRLPIVPVSYQLRLKYVVPSWDRFQIPLPFGRCNVVLDQTLTVDRHATSDQREQARSELERRLRMISCVPLPAS